MGRVWGRNGRKRSWSNRGEAAQTVAKPRLITRKISTVTVQLDRLKLAIDQKRSELANKRGVVFHQDNAKPHTSVVTNQNLWELGWEVLMHPPYSPDLAPSDYHFFSHCKALRVIRNWDQEKVMKIDYYSFSPIKSKTSINVMKHASRTHLHKGDAVKQERMDTRAEQSALKEFQEEKEGRHHRLRAS
ncbi:transposase [Trichonephila clavipes]|nr:transposase [Trichonephila clavipes]